MEVDWTNMLGDLEGRNATEEFARRSMKNLEFIVASLESGADGESVEK